MLRPRISSPPVLTAVTSYDIGKFIHVVAVVVGIGATYSYGVILGYVERQAPKSVPSIYTSLQRTDRFIVTPGLIVILLAGLWLVNKGDISMGESWVMVGLVAVIALLGLTHAYFAPRWRKGIELAKRDLKKGNKLIGMEWKFICDKLVINITNKLTT